MRIAWPRWGCVASGVGQMHELAAVVVGMGGAVDQSARFEPVDADGRGRWVDFGGAGDLAQGHGTVGEHDQHLDLPESEVEGGAQGAPAILSGDELA